MTFAKKLERTMQELQLNQRQVCNLTGKSRGSVSQYLSGKQTPSEESQSAIAVALGLDPDHFKDDQIRKAEDFNSALKNRHIPKLLPDDVAACMGLDRQTVRKGLQQGVFPWGYAIKTTNNRWTYFINAKKFAEIEGLAV